MKPNICFYTQDRGNVNIYEFGFSNPDTTRKVGPYVRNVYLMHIVTKGVCHFCDFDAEAGSVFIISKDKLHSFYVEPGYEHYWFGFDGSDIISEFGRYSIPIDNHILLKVTNFEYLKIILDNAMNYAKDDINIVHSAFRSVFPLIKQRYEDKSVDKRFEIAKTAMKFIDNNYQKQINMEDVAKYVSVTEKYLCHRFKEYFNVPPQQYLISIRMKKAKSLLKGTELKVKEIAMSVGYKSQLTFSYAFKNREGISPKEYREKYSIK